MNDLLWLRLGRFMHHDLAKVRGWRIIKGFIKEHKEWPRPFTVCCEGACSHIIHLQ